jgi:hypothetical protein
MRILLLLIVSAVSIVYGRTQDLSCLYELYPDLRERVKTQENFNTDSNAVKQYWQAWREVIFNQPDSAYFFAGAALKSSLACGYNFGLGGSLLRMGNARQYAGNYAAAQAHMLCAIDLEFAYGTPRTQAIALSDLGIVLYNTRDLDLALDYLNQSLTISKTHQLPRQEAQALQNMARVYNYQGFHKLAIQKNLASLKIFESQASESMIASGYNTLGVTYLYADEYQKAIESFRKTASLTKRIGESEDRFHAEALMNMAYCFDATSQYDSAIYYYNQGYTFSSRANDIYGILMSNSGRASALNHLQKPEEARGYLLNNLAAYDTLDASFYQTTTLINLSESYIQLGQLKKAEDIVDQLNALSLPLGKLRIEFIDAEYKLALVKKDVGTALEKFKEITAIRDSLSQQTKATELAELQLIYDLEKKESEIKILEERQEKDQWRKGALGLGILATSLLGFLAFIYQRQWARRRRERDQARLAAMEIEKRDLSEEVMAKEREITAQSVISANQKEELLNLRNSLENLRGKSNLDANEFNRLIRQVDQQLSQDHGWERVLETFKEVHPGFIEGLTSEYPQLTSSDLRLAALMRMNLDSKTIASLVHISPDSVKRSRNRFRQKIKIDSSIRLQDWIARRNN